MDELLLLAATMGIAIEWEDFLPVGWMGAYSLASRSIHLLRGMAPRQKICVLAHELGHAHYRHARSDMANEWHADKWAAQKLITPEAFVSATQITGGGGGGATAQPPGASVPLG